MLVVPVALIEERAVVKPTVELKMRLAELLATNA